MAGTITLEEYVSVVQGAVFPGGGGAGAEVIGPALLGVYAAGDGPGVTVEGHAVIMAGLVELAKKLADVLDTNGYGQTSVSVPR